MTVQVFQDRTRWNAYVHEKMPVRTYHLWVWRDIIEATFGHSSYYIAEVVNDQIQGVLPLVFIRSRLFGNALVSIPFFSYGGILADNTEVAFRLQTYAAELGAELGAHHVELRQGDEFATPWLCLSRKVTMEVPLPASSDDYLSRLSSSRRKRLRYLLRNHGDAEWGGMEQVSTFYQIFATNMRNLGTPVYPEAFFRNQICRLPDRTRILILRDGGRAVAAAFVIAHGDTLELPWAASLPESRKKEAPTVMYWTLIEYAIREGFRTLDLGRCTPHGGNYEFKQHWRPIERPLHWYYWLPGGSSAPDLRPDNPKFKFLTEVWKRMPLTITNRLGPFLVRSIP